MSLNPINPGLPKQQRIQVLSGPDAALLKGTTKKGKTPTLEKAQWLSLIITKI